MITAICNECGRVWEALVILGIVRCPECGSRLHGGVFAVWWAG
jgi:DNA-directed RNA polymerase subunit RPC12/RpoP